MEHGLFRTAHKDKVERYKRIDIVLQRSAVFAKNNVVGKRVRDFALNSIVFSQREDPDEISPEDTRPEMSSVDSVADMRVMKMEMQCLLLKAFSPEIDFVQFE